MDTSDIPEGKYSYWHYFYSGLSKANQNTQNNQKVGNAIKNILSSSEQLVSFLEINLETTLIHLNPILLHGLPKNHMKRFIEFCVFNEENQYQSVIQQLFKWREQINHEHFPITTLIRFFDYGGDMATTYTQLFIELRDAWNSEGIILDNIGLPRYLLDLFEEVAKKKFPSKKIKKAILPVDQIPYLYVDLARFFQPFLVIPEQRVLAKPFLVTLTVAGLPEQTIPLNTYTRLNQRYSREPFPEDSEFSDFLLVPPAQNYNIRFNNDKAPYIIDLPDQPILFFDTQTGKHCDLRQDIRWPKQLIACVSKQADILTDGDKGDIESLKGPWKDWFYVFISNASKIEFCGYQFQEKYGRSRLNIILNQKESSPYWLHMPDGITLITELEQVNVSFDGLDDEVGFFSFVPEGITYSHNRLEVKTGQELRLTQFEWNPGIYNFRLEQGLENVSIKILFLPGAQFIREPEQCITQKANCFKFFLPVDLKWEFKSKETIEYSEKNGWNIIEDCSRDSLNLEIFYRAYQSISLQIILQDIRWRRYGYAKMPDLNNTQTQAEHILFNRFQNLPDTRLRVEVELPLYEQLKALNKKNISIEVHDAWGHVLIPNKYPVKYHQCAFWDFDMSPLVKDAFDITDANFIQIGLPLENSFVPLMKIHLVPELNNLHLRSVGYLEDDFETYELSWLVNENEFPTEQARFYLGKLSSFNKNEVINVKTDGNLEFKLPRTQEHETWGIYPFLLDSRNPFSVFKPFNPKWVCLKFERIPQVELCEENKSFEEPLDDLKKRVLQLESSIVDYPEVLSLLHGEILSVLKELNAT